MKLQSPFLDCSAKPKDLTLQLAFFWLTSGVTLAKTVKTRHYEKSARLSGNPYLSPDSTELLEFLKDSAYSKFLHRFCRFCAFVIL